MFVYSVMSYRVNLACKQMFPLEMSISMKECLCEKK